MYANMDIKLTMPFFWENWSWYIQLNNVLGLFGVKNVQQYTYDITYSKKNEQKGLPFFPIFGVRGVF